MLVQPTLGCRGQHRDAVLISLAAPNQNLVSREIDILYAKLQTFENTQPRPVKEHRHQSRCSLQLVHHSPHLVPRKRDGKSHRPLCPRNAVDIFQRDLQELAVEERYRSERLVLRRGAYVRSDRQCRQELNNVLAAKLAGVSLAVKADVAKHPSCVGSRCPLAVMTEFELLRERSQ